MRTDHNSAGFTLAELLMASLLLSLVLGGLFVSFDSSIKLWRNGEANLRTYQDGRTACAIMSRELNCLAWPGLHLMEGEDDEIVFYAVVPPMDVEEESGPRLMQVTYRLKRQSGTRSRVLLREERIVESPLPAPPEEGQEPGPFKLGLGREQEFELAGGVLDFELRYFTQPEESALTEEVESKREEARRALARNPALSFAANAHEEQGPFKMADEFNGGETVLEGIAIELTLEDPRAEEGRTVFRTAVVLRRPETAFLMPVRGQS